MLFTYDRYSEDCGSKMDPSIPIIFPPKLSLPATHASYYVRIVFAFKKTSFWFGIIVF